MKETTMVDQDVVATKIGVIQRCLQRIGQVTKLDPRMLEEVDVQNAGVISPPVAQRMQKIVGFHNVAVHEYQNLDPAVLKSILLNNLRDFEDFYSAIPERTRSQES